jgi:putative hydrolase of the HAD superfamily
MKKVVIFDLGGTLMEYQGMPFSWVDYYELGFRQIAKDANVDIPDNKIMQSVEIMKSYNPRVNYRELEYSPQTIFREALSDWNVTVEIENAICSFFQSIQLKPHIFEDTIPAINELHQNGYLVAALTDLPTAMPDDIFKRDIKEILNNIDLYVSSQSCGYRKPNKAGVSLIADAFNVNIKDLLLIGDEDKDSKTAQNAGCNFLLLNRKRPTQKAEIPNLCNLLRIINDDSLADRTP